MAVQLIDGRELAKRLRETVGQRVAADNPGTNRAAAIQAFPLEELLALAL